MNLFESLNILCKKTLNETNDWYIWREIDESKIPVDIKLPKGNQYLRNIFLKEELHKAWKLEVDPIKKGEIIKYYITVWGGIHSNSDYSMNKYMKSSPESLIELGKKGIASWSKALVIHNPNKYAIFDAKVSISLNCLQIINNINNKVLYPLLSSRNVIISRGKDIIMEKANQGKWWKVDDSKFYFDYLNLLQKIAEMRCTNISTVEMLLFAKAESLVTEIKNFA